MPANSLPIHQQLLSSLIASLSEPDERCIPQPGQRADNTQPQRHQYDMTSRRRTLLLTLHVLFPSLVLPALELVDNRLVTRLQAPRKDVYSELESVKACGDGDAQNFSSSSGPENNNKLHMVFGSQGSFSAYVVQSSSPSRSLARELHTNTVSQVHIVHLAAWNCSCKDFQRNKFYHQGFDDRWSTRASDACSPDLADNTGASLLPCTSVGEKNVPCCKHLLACLVMERLTESQARSGERAFSKSEIATLIVGL